MFKLENFVANGIWNWPMDATATATSRINMFQQLFERNLGMPMAQPCLTEAPWTMAELKKVIARLKANKAADDAGLVAELLHHSSEVMLEALLHLFRTVLLTGRVPETWTQTILYSTCCRKQGSKINIRFSSNWCGQAVIQNICVFRAG